jgi:serine/threonine-protein kinase
MNAMEPVLRAARPDPVAAARRVEDLSKQNPLDVELYDWLALLRYGLPEALSASERAIALDPADAWAWQLRALSLSFAWRLDEARDALEHCTAVSLATADCLVQQAWTDMLAGRCADFEDDARRAVDRVGPLGRGLLASALVSTGRPEAAVREEWRLMTESFPEADRKLTTTEFDAQLALIHGDFAEARALASQEAAELAAHATSRSERIPHYRVTMQLLTAALEMGDASGTRNVAQDFVDRSGSWSAAAVVNFGVDQSLFIAHLASGDFEARRRERMDAWQGAGASRGLVWPYAFAAPAVTPEEARAALDELPKYVPITSYVMSFWLLTADVGLPDAAVGHAYLLAGKPHQALPYLRRAVGACADFDAPLAHTRAALDLGEALEATRDKAGACEAYGKVLARWGHAKPRSVTADKARARSKALGCGGR